jgi:parvulin-like peptidyl-prolyl isomerase
MTMLRLTGLWSVPAVLLLSGCANPPAAPNPPTQPTATTAPVFVAPSDPVIARIGDAVVTREQLYSKLRDAYGFNMLMTLVQHEMARSEASKAGITLGASDFAAERERTLKKLFPQAKPEDYPSLVQQLVQREGGTIQQFDLVIETNAMLRELSKPIVAGSVNEDNLRARFNAVYGERVRVRHIQFDNLQSYAAARARLDAGEDFAKVAAEVSTNRSSASRGGELKPFARHTPGLPTAFVDAAFALQPGQLSDPVQADGAYHLLKLEERLAPRVVKYEDVRDSLREDMVEELLDETVKFLRNKFADAARTSLVIDDPVLRKEFEDRRREREATLRDREALRQRLEREREERERAATQPTTAPGTQPATQP